MPEPLPIPRDEWRWRWVQVGTRGEHLHRVSILIRDPDGLGRGEGRTVCGRDGMLLMPGILSRMGARRCPRCCKALGLPHGSGAPFNDETLPAEARDA